MEHPSDFSFEETARVRTGVHRIVEFAREICPNCGNPVDTSAFQPLVPVCCPLCASTFKALQRFDHFILQQMIGRGGMGAVYRALDQQLGRLVAVKLLRDDLTGEKSLVSAFEKEATVTALLQSPFVVRVYGVGSKFGLFYVAMELLQGGALSDLLRSKGALDEAHALKVGLQVAQGLLAAHQHGLVHRDIKPGNILFADAQQQHAKLADFGLAVFENAEGAEDAESSGEVFGSPNYLPPERLLQIREDFRADIYSLGATLYHALAGRPPFDAETPSLVAMKRLKDTPLGVQTFAPHVSGSTAAILSQMLERERENRQASLEELISQLSAAQTNLETRSGGRPSRIVLENEETSRWGAWVAAGMITVALLILFLSIRREPSDRTPRPTAATSPRPAPVETAPPSAPVLTGALADEKTVRLTWTGSAGAAEYNVYRANSSGDPNAALIRSGLRGTSYTDEEIAEPGTFYYRIKAANERESSGFSNEIGVRMTSVPALLENGGFESNQGRNIESPWQEVRTTVGSAGVDLNSQKAHSGRNNAWISMPVTEKPSWFSISQPVKFSAHATLKLTVWAYAEEAPWYDLIYLGLSLPDGTKQVTRCKITSEYTPLNAVFETKEFTSGSVYIGVMNPPGGWSGVIVDDVSLTSH